MGVDHIGGNLQLMSPTLMQLRQTPALGRAHLAGNLLKLGFQSNPDNDFLLVHDAPYERLSRILMILPPDIFKAAAEGDDSIRLASAVADISTHPKARAIPFGTKGPNRPTSIWNRAPLVIREEPNAEISLTMGNSAVTLKR